MPLSTSEKIKILMFLGWPAKTIVPGSMQFSNIVTDRLNNLLPEIEVEVRLYLERLEILEDKFTKGLSRAGVKRIDDIELNGEELPNLKREKRRVAMELASLLDIKYLSSSGSSMGSICV